MRVHGWFVAGGVVAMLGLAVTSCGKDDDDKGGGGASCGTFAACGGNPVGTWSISKACPESYSETVDDTETACADSMLVMTMTSMTGTVTVNSDNTYATSAVTGAYTQTMTVKPACATAWTTTVTEICTQQNGQDGMTCTVTGGNCVCTGSDTFDDSATTGTWAVAGNNLTLTENGGTADTSPFCVSGTTMRVADSDTGDSYTILTKQ